MIEQLSSHQKLIQRCSDNWPKFQEKRKSMLKQVESPHGGSEQSVRHLIKYLFTNVLDWKDGEVYDEVDGADLVLISNSVKHLIIELKSPCSLTSNQHKIELALEQAKRYAHKQAVKRIAISDGNLLYAADIQNGGIVERLYTSLAQETFDEDLWWLSLHGIYRPRENYLPKLKNNQEKIESDDAELFLHPKYKVPAACFAYVGDPTGTNSWKLPYLLKDGSPDAKRLPKAITAVISNYRGVKVGGIPEKAIFDVLQRLSSAAEKIGKMPHQNPKTTDCYKNLADVLNQLS